jgi:hypothetical protein
MNTQQIIAVFAMSCLVGCYHPASPISVASSVDRLSAIQGNLSAVDGKSVVVEEYLRNH